MERTNWHKLKQDYLLGNQISVISFLRDALGPKKAQKRSGHIAQKTKGWRKEKEALLLQQEQLTVQTVLKSRYNQISLGLGLVYDVIVQRLGNKRDVKDMSAADLKLYWNILVQTSELVTDSRSALYDRGMSSNQTRSASEIRDSLLLKLKNR
jgi:hypothetical protein